MRTTAPGRIRTRVAASAAAAALAAGLAVAVAPGASAAPPTYDKTLVGASPAAMYPSGFEYDAANDRLVVADTGLDRILFYSLTGTKLGQFGSSGTADGQFLSPRDAAVDPSGNIYVGDAENNRVQKFSSAGTWQWTVGGVGSCNTCLNTPIGVTWDATNSQLLVASTGQNLVKAFDTNGNYIWKSPASGTGSGQIDVNGERDVTRGPDGRLWITDYKHHQMKAFTVDAAGTFADADGNAANGVSPILTLGDGLSNGHGDGQLNFPYNVVFTPESGGHFTAYVSDTGNGRVARWDVDNSNASAPTAAWLPQFGAKCSVHPDPCPDPPGASGQFNHLRRVVRTPADGNIFAADFWGNGIEVFTSSGAWVRSIEGATAPVPGVAQAFGVDVAADGTTYVMDRLNQRLERFNAAGTYLNQGGSRGTAGDSFSWPEAVAVAPDGTVWAGDTRNDRISHWPADLSTTPNIPTFGSTGTAVGQFNFIEDIEVAPDGKPYVADTRNNRIQVFDPGTSTFTAFGTQGSGNGQFAQPEGVAVSSSSVYVADTGNNRIQKLSLAGAWQASSSVSLSSPEGVDVAPDGTVWVADTGNNRIVHLSADLGTDLGDTFGSTGTGNLQFDRPHTLAATATKLFVADTFNNRVQVFSLGGGTGPGPFAPEYASQISDPGGVASLYPAGGVADGAGNRYLADSGGSRIVKLDPGGAQTTVYAAGLNDPRKVTFDASGDLWVTDTSNSQVKRITTSGTLVTTLGGTSVLKTPYGAESDATGVYVADTYNNRVRKLDKASGAVLWTATTCSSQTMSRPRDVTVGSDGNVYTADTDRARIVVLDPSTGACVRTFGSSGAGNGQFKSPRAITSDGAGGIWVAEAWNYRAQHLSNTGTFIAKTNSTQGSGSNQFRAAQCVFMQGSTLNVCDTYNYRINRYTVNGSGAPTYLDSIGGTPAANGGFNGAFGVAYGPGGELYAADWFNHRIQKFAPDGSYQSQWGGYGFVNGALIFPTAVAVSGDGANVLVTDSENNRLDVFTSAGTFVRQVKPTVTAQAFSRPHQAAFAADGTYWVADTLKNRVVHINDAGTILHQWTGNQLLQPRGIALDSAGNVYVSNTNRDRVEKYNQSGTLLQTMTTSVNDPYGLTVSTHDGEERLLVADSVTDRVVAMKTDGTGVVTFGTAGSGNGQLETPKGVAMSPTTGKIAVADFTNNRVSVWNASGGGSGTPDTTPADSTTAVPTTGQSFPAGTVAMSGNATDNVAVGTVTVAIKDSGSGLWWNGSGWGSTVVRLNTTLGSPGATSTTWSYAWPAPGPGHYGMSVIATDASGNRDSTPTWTTFTVAGSDTTAPNGTVAVPSVNQALSAPVTFSGNATDNVGVKQVQVAVKNRTTGQWWNGTAWQASFKYFTTATLGTPNGTSTTWSYTWAAATAGSYSLMVRADDTSGNQDPTKPFVNFTVS